MKVKKIIKYFIILLIVSLIIGGIIYYVRNNRKPISVYSISEMSMDNYWEDNSNSEGMVREDKMQSVYVTSTQQVEKVAVKEGQKVKKGDVLLKYNTTLTNIELERKQIDIKKLELDLTRAQNELAKIQTYQPNVPIYGSLPVEIPQEPQPTVHTELPNLTAPEPTVEKSKEISPAPLTGNGSNDNPYLFIWNENKEYDKTFIESLIKRAGDSKTEVVAVFMVRENNSLSGNLLKATKIKFAKKVDDYTFSILNIDGDFDPLYPNGPEDDEQPIDDTPIPEVGPIYTATEIQKMTLEKEKEISEISLNIKIAKNEYKKLQAELDNTTIYSNIDGIVKTVLSKDSDELATKPIVVVSGGGGYFITGSVSELNLDKVKVGQKVNVQSYESGNFAEGTIEAISTYPTQNNYYGMGNNNVSYYPYTVKVGEDVSFKEGEYVMLSMVSEEETTNSFFIPSAFVISENGKNFAYIANDENKLEKRNLIIGKNMHGMIEIYSGINRDEMIAFPYGKKVKEGASTEEASMEDLYMRYVELG